MRIETKYGMYEKCFCIEDNKICEAEIIEIKILYSESEDESVSFDVELTYTLELDQELFKKQENELFKTKEDLIKSL